MEASGQLVAVAALSQQVSEQLYVLVALSPGK
jgi:hypothetical protein